MGFWDSLLGQAYGLKLLLSSAAFSQVLAPLAESGVPPPKVPETLRTRLTEQVGRYSQNKTVETSIQVIHGCFC